MNALIPIVAGQANRARCRHCLAPIVWVTKASSGRPGDRARAVALNGQPVSVRRETQPNGITLDFISPDQLHRATCAKRHQLEARARQQTRDRHAHAVGQGRMF